MGSAHARMHGCLSDCSVCAMIKYKDARQLTPEEVAKAVKLHWNGQWLTDQPQFERVVDLARGKYRPKEIEELVSTSLSLRARRI